MALIPYAGKPQLKGRPKKLGEPAELKEADAEKGRLFSKPKHKRLTINFTEQEVLAITEFGWQNGCRSFSSSLRLAAKQGRRSCP